AGEDFITTVTDTTQEDGGVIFRERDLAAKPGDAVVTLKALIAPRRPQVDRPPARVIEVGPRPPRGIAILADAERRRGCRRRHQQGADHQPACEDTKSHRQSRYFRRKPRGMIERSWSTARWADSASCACWNVCVGLKTG